MHLLFILTPVVHRQYRVCRIRILSGIFCTIVAFENSVTLSRKKVTKLLAAFRQLLFHYLQRAELFVKGSDDELDDVDANLDETSFKI
jgi:hypothetical protein